MQFIIYKIQQHKKFLIQQYQLMSQGQKWDQQDRNILVSIRSDDEEGSQILESQKKYVQNLKKQKQSQVESFSDPEQPQIQIKDTLNFSKPQLNSSEKKSKQNQVSEEYKLKKIQQKSCIRRINEKTKYYQDKMSSDQNSQDEQNFEYQRKQSEQSNSHNTNSKHYPSMDSLEWPADTSNTVDFNITDEIETEKLQQKKNQQKKVQTNHLNQYFYGQNIEIGKSLYTSKPIQGITQKQQKKKSQTKTVQHLQVNKTNENQEQETLQSVYMKSQDVVKKKKNIEFQLIGNRIYWKYFNNEDIQIDQIVLAELNNEFMKKQILLPIISEDQFKMEYQYLTRFIKQYTQLLNQAYSKQFIEAYKAINQNKRNKTINYDNRNNFSKTDQFSEGKRQNTNFYSNVLQGYFSNTYKKYSKAQKIRSCLVKKVEVLRSYLRNIKKIFSDKQNSGDVIKIKQQQVEKQIKQLKESISQLDMLTSFQNTQNQCKSGSKEIQLKIWNGYLSKNKKLQQIYIKYLEKQNKKELKEQILFII